MKETPDDLFQKKRADADAVRAREARKEQADSELVARATAQKRSAEVCAVVCDSVELRGRKAAPRTPRDSEADPELSSFTAQIAAVDKEHLALERERLKLDRERPTSEKDERERDCVAP